MAEQTRWEPWRPFPDPSRGDFLTAPYSCGVYWLRLKSTGETVYIGESKNVAYRMTSLLPAPLGRGTRQHGELRAFLLSTISDTEYRTTACVSKSEAVALEQRLRSENKCMF